MQSNLPSDLSLWLDSYDDIYSDFDSRIYLRRRVSEDFLDELKESFKYRKEHADNLILLLAPEKRNEQIEQGIISSLEEQFRLRYEMLYKKERKIKAKGILFVITGIIVMVLDSVIVYWGSKTYSVIATRVVLEPAGWFLIWNGLDLLMNGLRKARHETFFYRKAGELKIHFKDLQP